MSDFNETFATSTQMNDIILEPFRLHDHGKNIYFFLYICNPFFGYQLF